MVRLLSFMMTVSFAITAKAVLGQKTESIDNDQKGFSTVRRSKMEKAKFTVHEISNDNLTIREYADSKGIVFGLVWEGTRHPSLKGLLGDYFPDFSDAVQAAGKVRGRRSFSMAQGSKVIVEKSGHMGGVQGKAYAPELFPAGVSASDIQ